MRPRRFHVALALLALAGCEQRVGIRLGDTGVDGVTRSDGKTAAQGWAVGLGGAGHDGAAAIAIDPEGNLVVTGDFYGTARLGEKTLVATRADGSGAFVVKLDPTSGRVLRAAALEADERIESDVSTNSKRCMLNDLAVDGAGNIVVGTQFSGTVANGGKDLIAMGQTDALLVKLGPSLEVAWARGLGGAGLDLVAGVAVDAKGEVTATGVFEGVADFNGIQLTARGPRDSFVVRLDPAGATRWARQMGSDAPDACGGGCCEFGFGLALDAAGCTFATGRFMATASFGPFSLVADPKYGYSTYLAKLDPAGTFLRAEVAPTFSQALAPRRLALDSANRLHFVGYLEGGAVSYPIVAAIDPGAEPFAWTAAAPAVPTAAMTDLAVHNGKTVVAGITVGDHAREVLVARFDSSNAYLNSESAGGPGDDGGNSIAIDKAGNVYVAGWFSQTASFRGITLTSAGGHDGFVWKIPAPEP